MMNIFFGVFVSIFSLLSWRRFDWGLFLTFLLLPTYLIRTHLWGIPTTLLEGMVLILCGIFFLKNIHLFFLSLKIFFRSHYFLGAGIFLFLLGATINIFTAINVRDALGEWKAFYIEPLVFFFVLMAYAQTLTKEQQKQKFTNFVILPLLICGTFTSVFAIYQHFTGFFVPYSFWENRATYRVTAWYGFPNAVGLFLAPLFPLALSFFVSKKEKIKTLQQKIIFTVAITFLITSPFALFFAKGSGPILGVVAALGFLFLFSKKYRPFVVSGSILFLFLIFSFPQLQPLENELLAKNFSGSLRRDIWNETISLLEDHPFIGSGLASYDEKIVPYRHNHAIEVFHHPHNIFLTVWVNTGLVGLIGFLIVLTMSILFAFKTKTQETRYFLSSMMVILIMGLVDSPYIKNDLAILFWVFIFLLLHSSSSKGLMVPKSSSDKSTN